MATGWMFVSTHGLGFIQERRRRSRGDDPASVPPRGVIDDLHLRLPQPHSIESAPRARDPAQRRTDVAGWPAGPDFKTIADFRRDKGAATRNVCRQFVVLCRQLDLFSQSIIAIDGSKFKAVNNRDRNF